MKKYLYHSTLYLVLAPSLAHALDPGPASTEQLRYEIELEDGRFSPPVLRVPSGQKFHLEIENEEDHDTLEFSIPSLGFELAVTPGQERDAFLGPLDAGEYPFEDALNSSRSGVLKVE